MPKKENDQFMEIDLVTNLDIAATLSMPNDL